MARTTNIQCDICRNVIIETIYSVRMEFRRKRAPVKSVEYPDLCHDCGWELTKQVERAIETVTASRRRRPEGAG